MNPSELAGKIRELHRKVMDVSLSWEWGLERGFPGTAARAQLLKYHGPRYWELNRAHYDFDRLECDSGFAFGRKLRAQENVQAAFQRFFDALETNRPRLLLLEMLGEDEAAVDRWLEERPDEAWEAGYLDATIDTLKQLLDDYLKLGADRALRNERRREKEREAGQDPPK